MNFGILRINSKGNVKKSPKSFGYIVIGVVS